MTPAVAAGILKPRALTIWALLAALNLSAGVMVSTWPERQTDLETMQRWGRTWLVGGADVYFLDHDLPDYPPHAIVALAPLGLLGPQAAALTWTACNLVLAVLAVYLAVRIRHPGHPLVALTVPMLMFLSWGAFRTMLQFSLIALVLAMAAMRWSDTRRLWSGVCLGLALMKPQIAIPFVLWAIFTRRFRLVAMALGVVAAGFLVYCLRVGTDPVAVIVRYVAILRTLYTGDAIMVGLAQMRPLVQLASSNSHLVDAASLTIALVLLAGVWLLGLRERAQHLKPLYSAPALAAIWSLLTFHHLGNGFILLLPAAVLLLWPPESAGGSSRYWIFWALQLWMMFPPRTAWRYGGTWLPESAALSVASIYADRVLMLALFVSIATLSWRRIQHGRRPAVAT